VLPSRELHVDRVIGIDHSTSLDDAHDPGLPDHLAVRDGHQYLLQEPVGEVVDLLAGVAQPGHPHHRRPARCRRVSWGRPKRSTPAVVTFSPRSPGRTVYPALAVTAYGHDRAGHGNGDWLVRNDPHGPSLTGYERRYLIWYR
jgi:hypothetical protein